jgi:elongation factor P
MIGGTELRKGVVIELNDKLYQVVEYQHVKMKRTALAKVKLRDIIGGHTIEQSFQSGDKFVRARLDYRPVEYIYKDGELYYFMDKETFEQIPLRCQPSGRLHLLSQGRHNPGDGKLQRKVYQH